MHVAAAQIACVPGDVTANLRKLGDFAERAKKAGAELVVFPEMADTGYVMSVIRDSARPWNEGAVPALQEMAKRLSLAIICGVSEREDAVIYNSQVLIDAAGRIAGKYRKTHLFCSGSLDEKECFAAGDDLQSYSLGGFELGLTICYDLRFPEIYRRLALEERANLLVISSAWPFPRDEHLRILTLARAIENQSYAVLANRVGTDDKVAFCGSSRIIDPNGVILAAASPDSEELIVAELTQDALTKVRSRMAVFADRREDLYAAPVDASLWEARE